ncbi:MAG: YceI family protein [Bacteroidota bacterium]|jgi:polyisoprenoid-binding protein YceI|nr:YceI family protein [Bacteroidota bacterium]
MTTKWTIDPMHSEVEFKVKHLMISTVTGKFGTFTASAEADAEDFSDAKISFSADINSINTGNEQRDGHLKSDDFFNAEQFPTLNFVSTGISKGANGMILSGDLTIRDVTKTISMQVEFNGTMVDPYGNHKAGFELTGIINRKDFNLKWSATTEAGGIVVSDEVKLICNIQMAKIVA